MIQAMLQNILQYKNLDLMPNNKKYNLIKLNNELLTGINKMKIRLNSEQYNMASIEYKRIIKNIDISFLRRLMFELQINFKTESNFLIDFSIDDDDNNLEQNILLHSLINHNEMRNIVKYLILKKYSNLKINENDKIKIATKNLINEISKVQMDDNISKSILEAVLLDNLNNIDKKDNNLIGGGNNEYDNILIVCVGLFFHDNSKIYNLCCDIIRFNNNKDLSEQIIERMNKLLRDDYPYKILLSQAIVKDEVDLYKKIYFQKLRSLKSDISQIMDKLNMDMITTYMPILKRDSQLLQPNNTFYMLLPIYMQKVSQGKAPPIEPELVQEFISYLANNQELQIKLQEAFSTHENIDFLEASAAFLLINTDKCKEEEAAEKKKKKEKK